MNNFLYGVDNNTMILLSLSIILFFGFLMTRITKKVHLPNVTGYILAGVIIGPCILNIIPKQTIVGMGFINDVALAFIAFGMGKFFKKEVLQSTGIRVLIITLMESLLAGIFITITMYYLFHLDLNFSLLMGAIATATAPASTMMTINQYHARGEFVHVLLQVVAFDDVVCLFVFSIVIAIIGSGANGTIVLMDIINPILLNMMVIGLGVLSGFVLNRLLNPHRSTDNRLILAIAMLLAITGLCSIVKISPLLACMVFGTTYINLTKDKELYHQINRFTPPILSIFFIVSGMNLDITALSTCGVIGAVYFVVRIVGKYLGAYLGALITHSAKNIKDYLGFALIPQAGVAIGLAFLGQRILPEEIGNMLLTIILSSSVLYELIGPACAKMALFSSGCIEKRNIAEASEQANTSFTNSLNHKNA